MRSRLVLISIVVTMLAGMVLAQGQRYQRLNPMISLMEQKLPVLGLYAPAVTPEGAKEALTNHQIDFIFANNRGLAEFADGLFKAGALDNSKMQLTHPIMLKIDKISENPAAVMEEISQQLNAGVTGNMFVEVESAQEVQMGLNGVRLKSNGGTRPDNLGMAPAYWGLTEAQYREKADLWPLNPNGELVNWSIIESKEGLANTREIAAVKGIGVLWPGAGTLGGVFSTTGPDGRRVRDDVAWENAIQQVLAACKEFNIACGYPAGTPEEIEKRMKQGFSVFLARWGDSGFKTVETGRRLSNRPTNNED